MKVSTKGRYALRIMIDLAEHNTGGYIRLKDITISYNLPQKWLSRIGLQQARIYVNGMNLWEKTALPPFMMPDIVDQMTSTENINGANLGKQYAFMRTFSFGMNVTF